MTEPSQDSVKGNLLYFSPSEQGPSYFTDSLLYICDHGDLGALGLIINRPLNLKLKDLFNSMKIVEDSKAEGNVYMGGPVNPGAIFILHSSEKKWDSTMEVSKDISLSTSEDAIQSIANCEGPESYLMTLGYSGWGVNQLETELIENAWVVIPENKDVIFNTDPSKQMEELSKFVGYDVRMISPDFGNA